jgi:large subunit ribosomal protein L10
MKGKDKKRVVVDSLEDEFRRAKVIILTDYRGLATKDLVALRRELGASGVKYKVVKNTLAALALEQLGRGEMSDVFSGPVAVAIGYDDEASPAKVLRDYLKKNNIKLAIKSGLLGGRVLTVDEVATLASLPSRGVLVSQTILALKHPFYSLVATLSNPFQKLILVLQSITTKYKEDK